MIKFVNGNTNGYSLIDVDTKRVYRFDGIRRACINDDAGFSPSNVSGCFDVDVLSVLRQGTDTSEMFLDLGSKVEKYKVSVGMSSLVKEVFKCGGFYIALSRDFVVGDKKYTQNIFVYKQNSNCNNVVSKLGGSFNVQAVECN